MGAIWKQKNYEFEQKQQRKASPREYKRWKRNIQTLYLWQMVNENDKYKNDLTQNIQEIWEVLKRSNRRLTGMEKGKNPGSKVQKNALYKIIKDHFLT